MKQEKDKLGIIANDFLLKPIFKYDLIELLVKYLPYKSIIEDEKSKIKKQITIKPLINLEKLSIEISAELVRKFMPTITKLQKSLNFDDLITFAKELEKFAVKQSINQLQEYCNQLNKSISTYNVDKIYAILKQLIIYIDK